MKNHKIIIVGAGAAGIGFAVTLHRLNIKDFIILEKGNIGDSFLKWPKTTRFITPSFTSNGFGFPDLNAIAPDTSPAFTFSKEHLSGAEYAEYLHLVAKHYDLPIYKETAVEQIQKVSNHYQLTTNKGTFTTTYLIMATGEYQNPSKADIKGAKHAMHYGEIDSFHVQSKESFVVIGGNESGCDALTNLAYQGNTVELYTNHFGKSETDPDPSISLAPITQERLQHIQNNPDFHTHIHENYVATAIKKENDHYLIEFSNGKEVSSQHRPILATGFNTCLHQIKGDSLFNYNEDGLPLVSKKDESTICNNVFLIGPGLRQDNVIFCYIYKFRQRFLPVIATIAERENWKLDEDEINFFKQNQLFLDDLSCCDVVCDC